MTDTLKRIPLVPRFPRRRRIPCEWSLGLGSAEPIARDGPDGCPRRGGRALDTHVATLQMKDTSERMSEALWGQG